MAEHPNAPRCRHVRTNGLRCGSPAMRNHKLCYYHKKTSGPLPMPKACLPNLEDGNALQLAIAHLARQVHQGGIEYRAAHIMADLYRLALRNFKNMDHSVVTTHDQVTVDEDMDNLNNTHTAEPITYEEEQEMMEEGSLPTREDLSSRAKPRDLAVDSAASGRSNAQYQVPQAEQGERSVAAREAGSSNDLSSRANPRDLAVEEPQRGGTGLAQAVRPGYRMENDSSPEGTAQRNGNARPFSDMSEEEQEAYIMRATGNKAYFMTEDQMPKHPPEPDDNLSLEELIKEAFAS